MKNQVIGFKRIKNIDYGMKCMKEFDYKLDYKKLDFTDKEIIHQNNIV